MLFSDSKQKRNSSLFFFLHLQKEKIDVHGENTHVRSLISSYCATARSIHEDSGWFLGVAEKKE